MSLEIAPTLARLREASLALGEVLFASALAAPAQAPRLEIVIAGSLLRRDEHGRAYRQRCGDVLYLPSGEQRQITGDEEATLLSLLFAKQRIVLTLWQWDGAQLQRRQQTQIARRGPRTGTFLLQALNEQAMQPAAQATARLTVSALLSHCSDLLAGHLRTAPHRQALLNAIRDYIDDHYMDALSRDAVARRFHITPNYLSQLFQRADGGGFNHYLNHVRLEQAKTLLKEYEMTIKAIAHACGYDDSNYFCRLFRQRTERTPSEYRRQYHSQSPSP
ncbi:helix-turn-helix domain-containing protein [Edwardsiella piscicida]|uniref:Helix-turn-helix domain-containing protein n=4 Tax=Edwardsiella TaxID=635 RepID=A0AAQ3C412_EDWPI|nr:helix-turn-helix domain-containing protein [Edwardsiella piscicida]ACY83760.1 hypothetical transcriptional regulator AraC family [Edwardsiella tarda EIB202]ADM40971.1 Putative ARAC-type regulatory protein [Edwardsiella tarda FL6-60]ARD17459.1 AraC family transcriptional regulator [Edwardsiella piscicida]EKS7792174.1 helix-turn-helix domain-containing protein [Edwardsiella piscicida]EKS7812298.1 helix-turn-helix domain-containing protein [Edwardsiella piscicida]